MDWFGHDRLSVYGIVDDLSDEDIREVCGMLLDRGLLFKNSEEYATLGVSAEGRAFLKDRERLLLRRPKRQEAEEAGTGSGSRGTMGYDHALFEKLRALRRRIASDGGVPPYVVFGDATLQQMAHHIPQNLNSLSRISGVGAVKLTRYGEDFLAVICEYARENGLGERIDTVRETTSRRRAEGNGSGRTSTHESTKLLLERGYSVEQTARERGLTSNTIVAHIETLVQQGELPDVRPFLPDECRIERIQDAFEKVGFNRLSPVKELLGDNFSYEEIRLVRAYARQQATERASEG